jgi:hypothetical protein
VVALRHSVIAGSGEAYKQLDCEVAERRAEVGATSMPRLETKEEDEKKKTKRRSHQL